MIKRTILVNDLNNAIKVLKKIETKKLNIHLILVHKELDFYENMLLNIAIICDLIKDIKKKLQ
jgi:hypothetical protein